MNKKSDKFKIGISGHRNIKATKKDTYLAQIKETLNKFVEKYPDKEILTISPLADGADRLFIQAATEIGLRYEVLLPMQLSLYQKDFHDTSYKEFNSMLLNARDYKVIPLYNKISEQDIASYGYNRDLQYREFGRKLIKSSNFMLFLWDGKESEKMGGTFDTLQYAKERKTKYKIINCERDEYG